MALLTEVGFTEGTGTTAADTSGNNRNVTSVPGWTTSQSGFGNAMTTTGNTAAGGRVQVPALSAYTISLRFRTRTPAGSYATIFGSGDGTAPGSVHLLVTGAMELTAYWPNGSVFATSGLTLTANTWYHVAFCYTGTSGYWVVNGVAAGTPVATAAGAQALTVPSVNYYLLGGSSSFPGDMDIDDLRIYDTALTAAEVLAIRDTPAGASPPVPVTGYLVQEDGTSKFALEDDSGFLVGEDFTAPTSYSAAASMTSGSSFGGFGYIPGAATSSGVIGKRNLHPSIWSTTIAATYRLAYPVAVSASNVQLEFPNWATDLAGTGDTATGNTLTLGAVYVETSGGTLYQVTFAGSVSTTLASGASAVSDVVTGLSVTAGTTIYIRTYVSVPSGGRKPRLRGYVNYPTEASRPGQNLANGTGSVSGSGDDMNDQYGPVKIYGDYAVGQPRYPVVIIGDSIVAGTGDNSASEANYGYWQRVMWPGARPYGIYALAGESAAQFVTTQGAKRQALISSQFVYAITEYGVNDMHGEGATLTQMKARVRAVASLDSTKLWYQATITPTSTSTDAWATTTNQTPGYISTTRQQFNDWVRDGMPESAGVGVATGTVGALRAGDVGHPFKGYIEVADYAETARNSSIWKAGYTDDGIHPSATGHAAIAAGVNISALVDVPASAVATPRYRRIGKRR